MLYKLIDNSTDQHLWIWIAEIRGSKVKILYGKENYTQGTKWIPWDSSSSKTSDWLDWRGWSRIPEQKWYKVPMSKEELFVALL